MSLDWANERYVRVYTRDTTTWKLCDWRARTVLLHLFRKVDRSGVLDVGEDGVAGLAAVLELPLEEIVEPGIAQLVKRGTVERTADAYIIPNFLDAQETSSSDAQRQRAAREKRRAAKRFRDEDVTKRDTGVTRGHAASQDVTPSLSDPILTEPSLAVPIQGDSEGSPSASHHQGVAQPVLALVPPEPPRKGKSSARQLPAAWKPSEKHSAIARERGVDLALEADKMRDWAAAGAETAVDWDARFSGWLRRATPARASPSGRHHGGGGALTGLDAFLAQQAEEKSR